MIRTLKNPNNTRSGRLTRTSRVYQAVSRRFVKYAPCLPSLEQYNLTICHERKFVWFRVAKVGTRTIFDLLDKENIALDAEHPMFCHYPVNAYKDYFRFAFVRNPWDRLVSCWQDKVVNHNYFAFSEERKQKYQSFDAFVRYVADLDVETSDHHIRPQARLIDLNAVDFVGRLETFQIDLETVLKRIGVETAAIGRKNASKKRSDYKTYYDERTRDLVAEIYRKDISLFNYEF